MLGKIETLNFQYVEKTKEQVEKDLLFCGAGDGTFVQTISVIEANALNLLIITAIASPLKNCCTVVRQFLYAVRVQVLNEIITAT